METTENMYLGNYQWPSNTNWKFCFFSRWFEQARVKCPDIKHDHDIIFFVIPHSWESYGRIRHQLPWNEHDRKSDPCTSLILQYLQQRGPTINLPAILQKRDNSLATSNKMMYKTTYSQALKLKRENRWVKLVVIEIITQ